ncbi:protease SohB [Litorivicinus sp.]|nr:protease SohB [Litorivicinus sp.]MDC1240409.1 protease SohB [Litorivicinus sp.]
MTEFLAEYGLFLLKTITIIAALLVIVGVSTKLAIEDEEKGRIVVTDLSLRIEKEHKNLELRLKTQNPDSTGFHRKLWKKLKGILTGENRGSVTPEKQSDEQPIAVVLEFKGDIKASQVKGLSREVTAILSLENKPEAVIIKLTSPGGLVHGYGLASSQLSRIRDAGIPLKACVDTVAASGGYMMAVCAEEIIAAPFAVLGSIGVVAQIPNIHRFLKNRDVDVELHTAGDNKRTLTMLGENTPEGRKKFKEDLEQTHILFKDWIRVRRPSLNLEELADGSIFYGSDALEKGLCDRLAVSDDVLIEFSQTCRLISIKWHEKKSLAERFGRDLSNTVSDRIETLVTRTGQDFMQL